jgi:CBS domain containing-hemolysin-like protein
MLLGEMIPKNVALAAPQRTALRLVPPLVAVTRALGPVTFGINAFANGILRRINVEPRNEVNSVFSEEELSTMVQDASDADLLNQRRRRMLQVTLELGDRPVSLVATPAPEVVFAAPDTTPEQLEQLAARTGFSRFPIIDSDEGVLGYLHIKDVLQAGNARDRPFPASAVRSIAHVPEDARLDDVLEAMRRSRSHLAAAVAADGTTTGVVTMADILKELVGPNQPDGQR